MKIVIDNAIPFIRGRFEKVAEVVYAPGNKIDATIVAAADALIIRTRTRCDSTLLKNSPVKIVASATIGTDHIDIPWCRANGIEVASAPGCNAPGVAQYVFASLFKAGFLPESHTLGIVGHGNVGSVVADWARDMGINTLICDPFKAEVNPDREYVTLEYLLGHSDAVTLHVPLTHDGPYPTLSLIDREKLRLLKPGAIIVNSSRGGVVDEEALMKEMKDRDLKAIVDVWINEPRINPLLLEMASIATPHIAGYSVEGKLRGTRMAIEAVEKALNISIDKSGLETEPPVPDMKVTKELIARSFNPVADSEALKKNPEGFEDFRNNYNYRNEPLFSILK